MTLQSSLNAGHQLTCSHETFAAKYTMYVIGRGLLFSTGYCKFMNHHNLPTIEGLTRGLIASTESICKYQGPVFPLKDSMISIEVFCNTTDLEFFSQLPFNILSKIQTLKLCTCYSQDVVKHTSTLLYESAELIAEVLESIVAALRYLKLSLNSLIQTIL